MQLLPALHSGGVERSTLETAAALVAAGHRSVVISAGGRLVEPLVAGGSEHIELPIGRKSLTTLLLIGALHRQLQQLRPHIVHARSRLPAWIGLAAMRGLSPRPLFFTSVHGLNSPGFYSGVMTRGDQVICVSNTVHSYVLKHWPKTSPARMTVISPGIDPISFPRGLVADSNWRVQVIAEHPQLNHRHWLLMPGRGTRLKGHSDAIELLAGLQARGIDACLWLLGCNEPGRESYISELKSYAETLGVADRLAVSAPRTDIAQAYAQSSLVLQLSRKPEAFGRTVIEALSIGQPVLGWAHGGVGELLAQLYPKGAVALGDYAGLLDQAARALLQPPPLPDIIPYTLAAMQSATLKLYEYTIDSTHR